VRRIISTLPRKRQTLFFSATLPRDIQSLARDILDNPVRIEVTPTATTVQKITQLLYRVEQPEKFALLTRLLKDPAFQRTLAFTRTKRGANRLAEALHKGGVKADAIHGNKAQGAREKALENFKRGVSRVLVATDIASRGIDVDGITHVVNYDLPDVPENYVHRIGRTARAGAEGVALTFCGSHEREELAAVEKLIRKRIPMQALPAAVARPSIKPSHGPKLRLAPLGKYRGRKPWRGGRNR
jgi:ATP-dependent RNA helicase RhlE